MATMSSKSSLAVPSKDRLSSVSQQDSYFGSASNEKGPVTQVKKRFQSYRLREKYERPWLEDPRMKKTKWNNWIVRGFFALGIAISGFICYTATFEVGNHSVCFQTIITTCPN